MLQFGVDLGGSKTEIIVLDEQGRTLLRERTPTPSQDYAAILNNIKAMVTAAADRLATQEFTLGLGIPGAISPASGLVKNANTTCLIGQPLQQDLQQLLNRPVVIANDADCLALSEATDGAGAAYKNVFCVIIGTGCGGGWVINKQLVSGPNAIAGEWGHNPMPWVNKNDMAMPCYCGQQGCIETYLSGPGFSHQASRLYGEHLSTEQWHQRALNDDARAQEVLHTYYHYVAKALASIINIMDPHAIVLGGGVSNLTGLYEQVPTLWQDYVFSDQVCTVLLPAQHGDSSGVRGAAWLGAQA